MNLLTDQLIRTRLSDGEVEIQSLPEMYEAMVLVLFGRSIPSDYIIKGLPV